MKEDERGAGAGWDPLERAAPGPQLLSPPCELFPPFFFFFSRKFIFLEARGWEFPPSLLPPRPAAPAAKTPNVPARGFPARICLSSRC